MLIEIYLLLLSGAFILLFLGVYFGSKHIFISDQGTKMVKPGFYLLALGLSITLFTLVSFASFNIETVNCSTTSGNITSTNNGTATIYDYNVDSTCTHTRHSYPYLAGVLGVITLIAAILLLYYGMAGGLSFL